MIPLHHLLALLRDAGPPAAAFALAALSAAAPAAYAVIALLDLAEWHEARRAGRPCAARLAKGAAHAVLFCKLLAL